ncbi:ABC transporter ATP-binding protein YxdL [Gimesia alba]|uniref:ABC transporter ATP-binding protein YxdL n=1 Tax=Gimesia alba TaxID=2527973 RepID=A0A517RIT4_9PLAN|nr:ATP-binding cassette domain-containing protein [Gimesia alba]QDT43784.1 ABC transporter ATP-binding protein YxdL [Gimesia alba]
MIQMQQLKFSYPQSPFRLSIPELEIKDAEKVAVIGPSGCGKTTLLNLFSGILIPEQGTLVSCGIDLKTLNDSQRRAYRISKIGFVFQEFELIDYLNVRENILLPYFINSTLQLDEGVQQRARELAAAMQIDSYFNSRIDRISQGERQRVAICRALLPQPQILLADEPTGNLDPTNKRLIRDLLLEHATKTNATLIMVTHDDRLLDQFERTIDIERFHELVETT